MPSPLVTVGFTTYNVERYLPAALDAILAQDFQDFEVVVCDNRSSDRTWEICQRYAASDGRVRTFQNPENLGLSGNFARVVGLARGAYFRYTAHDDLCAPTLLSACLEGLAAAGPRAVLAYPQTMIIDGDGHQLGPWDDALHLRSRAAWRRVVQYAHHWNLCNQMFGLLRTDQLRRTGLLRDYLGSDVTMLVELASLGQFVAIPQRLFFRRMHAGSTLQSGRSPRELQALLEPGTGSPRPSGTGPPRRSGRRQRPRLTARTVAAVLRLDSPAPTRWSCALAYPLSWWVRRARVRLGRLRRAVTGQPLPVAPWERPRPAAR